MINYNRLGYEIKRDLTIFSEKISQGLTRPKSKFVMQMIYGILAGNKVHLSEIARSLNEAIPFKKTIWRLSRNVSSFEEKEAVMENYLSQAKKQIDEKHAVIIIDNSDITKSCSPMMEAISDVRDGSTGEIKKGYYTIEAAVLSKGKKSLFPFMKKFFLLQRRALSVKPMKIYAAYRHCQHIFLKPVSVH